MTVPPSPLFPRVMAHAALFALLLAPLARACYAEGRRYVGAEIDPERHDKALARLAAYRGTL